ncbi:hypothetical protein PoB_002583800 [Plakobranchus ocellatus]|uniref:SMB domain-containing protein n=1 Tax=Plakobranchus ocellatus TaxID=259542 RepID=A0AAV3ZWV0_9GAST|nr:hypothetical protein PoB_002583800 [Plakobranchus ocellatus]
MFVFMFQMANQRDQARSASVLTILILLELLPLSCKRFPTTNVLDIASNTTNDPGFTVETTPSLTNNSDSKKLGNQFYSRRNKTFESPTSRRFRELLETSTTSTKSAVDDSGPQGEIHFTKIKDLCKEGKDSDFITTGRPVQESINISFDNSGAINSDSEYETEYDITEISTSIREHSVNSRSSENEAEYDITETSTSIQEHSVNRKRFMNSTNSFPSEDTSLSALDVHGFTDSPLTFTCEGHCGERHSFPCACSPTCVIYGTCCDNIAEHCPHIWEEGRTRFDHILTAEFICDKDSLHKIISCPRPVKNDFDEKSVQWVQFLRTNLKGEKAGVDSENRLSSDITGTLNSLGVVGENSTRPAEPEKDSKTPILQRLRMALSNVPVTDSDTGLTFINKDIYACNNMPESTALPWSVSLEYQFKSPTSLEDFDHGQALNNFQPEFNQEIFKAHICLLHIIDTCERRAGFEQFYEEYADKCKESFEVVFAKAPPHSLYRNRFCAYCNQGRHDEFLPLQNNRVDFKQPDFRVVFSLSEMNTMVFRLGKSSNAMAGFVRLPWSQAECSVPENMPSASFSGPSNTGVSQLERQPECSATCHDPSFTVRSDGICKAEHEVLLAVADDGLPPLCTAALTGLAQFLSCGLKSEVENLRDADFGSHSVSVVFDSSTNRKLYVVKMNIALTQISSLIFSEAANDFFTNVHKVAVLIKAFKDYRLLHIVCKKHVEETRDTALKVITTLPLASWMSMIVRDTGFSRSMEQLRGPVLDNQTTTTVCLTVVSSSFNLHLDMLRCMDDPVYESDVPWVHEFRSSPCFFYLENNESAASNGCVCVRVGKGFFIEKILPLFLLTIVFIINTI